MTTAPRSLWWDTCDDDLTPRPPLSRDLECDVAIIGGGFTGLWTARYLAEADPSLRIAVLEAEVCGHGASGRNGGWASALLPSGNDQAELLAAMRDTVDEVGRAASEDGIDCDFAKGGTLTLATNPAHVEPLRAAVDAHHRWLDATEARQRLDATGVLGASFTPDCAAIHPAKLARGLALAVEARGVTVFERTRVESAHPGHLHCDGNATVSAEAIVRATEAWTATMPASKREVLPIYSLMIATEPLDDATWERIGLRDRETFTDGRTMIIYGQRTADGRLAFGGRGAPYHFRSRISPRFDGDDRVFADLERVLRGLLPQIGSARVTHRWGGPLGVPRDMTASVRFDPTTGLGSAGGYVGDGVSTTNLAGRTLRDLILRRDTELTALPWVGHRSRRWEPEPLRWLGVNAANALAAGSDRYQAKHSRRNRHLERALGWFTG